MLTLLSVIANLAEFVFVRIVPDKVGLFYVWMLLDEIFDSLIAR